MTKVPRGVHDIRLAEEFAARLVSLSNSTLKQKIAVHKRLAAYYGSDDIHEERTLSHNARILDLVAQLPPEERDKYARQNLSVYDRIATVYANRGLIEKASRLSGKEESKLSGRAGRKQTVRPCSIAPGRRQRPRSVKRTTANISSAEFRK